MLGVRAEGARRRDPVIDGVEPVVQPDPPMARAPSPCSTGIAGSATGTGTKYSSSEMYSE
jgi:hypothetical protein